LPLCLFLMYKADSAHDDEYEREDIEDIIVGQPGEIEDDIEHDTRIDEAYSGVSDAERKCLLCCRLDAMI
jgi:hypothetical protein